MISIAEAARRRRLGLLGAIAAAGIAIAFALDPIAQDPAYHAFADTRAWAGVPNFWNVVSNVPFVLVGLHGMTRIARLRDRSLRAEFAVYCAGTALVGLGSGSYHLEPSTPTLVWDRLPMTVAFMALFALVLRDRVSARLGARPLRMLLVAGVASIAYWSITESLGRGDLRPYAVVQFLPMLLIPAILLLFEGQGLATRWLWRALAAYVVAKILEHFDHEILDATGWLSGHSLKHLAAALSALCVVLAATTLAPRLDLRHDRPT